LKIYRNCILTGYIYENEKSCSFQQDIGTAHHFWLPVYFIETRCIVKDVNNSPSRGNELSPHVTSKVLYFAGEEFQNRYSPKKIAFGEQISPTRLRNAVKHFAPLEPDEKPLMLYDETAFRSGKKGILITDRRIHSHTKTVYWHSGNCEYNIIENIRWAEIHSVGMEESNNLLINGWIFCPLKLDKFRSIDFIVHIIRAVVGLPEIETVEMEKPLSIDAIPILSVAELNNNLMTDDDALYILHIDYKSKQDMDEAPIIMRKTENILKTLFFTQKYGSLFHIMRLPQDHFKRDDLLKAMSNVMDLSDINIPAYIVIQKGKILLAGSAASECSWRKSLDELIANLDGAKLSSAKIDKLVNERMKNLKSAQRSKFYENWLMKITGLIAIGIIIGIMRACDAVK